MWSDLCCLFDLVQVGRFMTCESFIMPALDMSSDIVLRWVVLLIVNIRKAVFSWNLEVLRAQKRHMERVKANNPKLSTLGFSNLEVIMIGDVPRL